MAHFYGTLQGNRGEATRCGTKQSGIETYAASWDGAVRTHLYQDDAGRDFACVETVPWQGSGPSVVFYKGPWPMPQAAIEHFKKVEKAHLKLETVYEA